MNNNIAVVCCLFPVSSGSICSWTSAGPVVFENGQAPNYFRQTRKNSVLQNLLISRFY